jgi:hypothetical protein
LTQATQATAGVGIKAIKARSAGNGAGFGDFVATAIVDTVLPAITIGRTFPGAKLIDRCASRSPQQA